MMRTFILTLFQARADSTIFCTFFLWMSSYSLRALLSVLYTVLCDELSSGLEVPCQRGHPRVIGLQ